MDNVERKRYVKQEITRALLALLKDKALTEITVSELTAKAQVGRASFYRNYKTKEDILAQYLQTMIGEWEKEYTEKGIPSERLIKGLFQHLTEHRDFYSLLYQKNLFYLFRNALKTCIIKDQPLSNPEAYAAAFVSYGLYGWIKEWLARGMQESAEEIDAFLKNQAIVKPVFL